jgi:hypothetical protein
MSLRRGTRAKEREQLWPRANSEEMEIGVDGSDETPAILTDPVIRETFRLAVDYLGILKKRGEA